MNVIKTRKIDITKEDLNALKLVLFCANYTDDEQSYETSDAINKVKKLIQKIKDEFEFHNDDEK